MKNYRHGDTCYVGVSKIPKGLKVQKSNVVLFSGSGGNPHTFEGGSFYKKEGDGFILGYLKAKNTKLFHVEHSPKGVLIKDGLYEVRKQVEYTHEGLRQVID